MAIGTAKVSCSHLPYCDKLGTLQHKSLTTYTCNNYTVTMVIGTAKVSCSYLRSRYTAIQFPDNSPPEFRDNRHRHCQVVTIYSHNLGTLQYISRTTLTTISRQWPYVLPRSAVATSSHGLGMLQYISPTTYNNYIATMAIGTAKVSCIHLQSRIKYAAIQKQLTTKIPWQSP